MKPECEFLTKTLYDPAIFWSMIGAIATVILVFVAYWQLKNLARTSRSDFLFRLRSDFFNDDARRLIFLAEHKLLKFHGEDEIPYFEILGRDRPRVADRMRELNIEGDTVSMYLVDDKLLGPIEDIGVLERLGLLTLNEVYEAFVTYINICVESPGLKEYIQYSRKDPEDDDVYDNLLYMHEKLQKKAP
ncbi:MAG: hypothetical protein WBL33_08190, partial [Candidatus Acidiferrales bacterium]